MNNNMTGFRHFFKDFSIFVLWRKVASALEGLRWTLVVMPIHAFFDSFKVVVLRNVQISMLLGLALTEISKHAFFNTFKVGTCNDAHTCTF